MGHAACALLDAPHVGVPAHVIHTEIDQIPSHYVVERVRCSSKAARGEDLQVEHPVWCGDASTFDFHATLAGMLSPTLIGD